MFAVIIPTKNRPDDLQRIIDSIKRQTLMPSRIIIVDQSIEKTVVNFSGLDSVIINHICDSNISGLTEAKNIAVQKCSEDTIYFFDDDIILDENYFEKIEFYFKENKEIYGICGRQKNSISSKFKVFMFNLFHFGAFKDIRKKCNSGYIKHDLVQTTILPGGITAYRREVFDNYLFDEVLIKYCLGEDMDFSYRVSKKYKLVFATKVLALHNHSTIGRYDPVESFACKKAGYAYFYKKNVKKTFFNYISYIFVKIGLFFDAANYDIRNKGFKALKGLKKGKKYVKNDFKNVPFIDYDKYEKNKNLFLKKNK